jgi:hypothetical protein
MIAYPKRRQAIEIAPGHQRLILPPEIVQLSAAVDIDRSPICCRCECGHLDVVCVPNADGELHWTCACGRSHAIGFKPEIDSHGEWSGVFQRQPIEEMCKTAKCEKRNFIVLPAGDGYLRWTCPGCCAVWAIDFKGSEINWYRKP